MRRRAFAPGKIILSGEYAVVFGAAGLALPAPQGMEVHCEEDVTLRALNIIWEGVAPAKGWKAYAEGIIEHCASVAGHPWYGRMHIRNELPLGKGMGASTALVIAIARCLLGEKCEREARGIEDTVNPGNSGIDFAVIWSRHPLRFQRGTAPENIRLPDKLRARLEHTRLIDTGKPQETTPELVAWVRSRGADVMPALGSIAECTERLLGGEDPLVVFPDHHRAQVALGVVPQATQRLIADIEKAGGAAKVIGAGGRTGGGGMVLGLHQDISVLEKIAQKHTMPFFR